MGAGETSSTTRDTRVNNWRKGDGLLCLAGAAPRLGGRKKINKKTATDIRPHAPPALKRPVCVSLRSLRQRHRARRHGRPRPRGASVCRQWHAGRGVAAAPHWARGRRVRRPVSGSPVRTWPVRARRSARDRARSWTMGETSAWRSVACGTRSPPVAADAPHPGGGGRWAKASGAQTPKPNPHARRTRSPRWRAPTGKHTAHLRPCSAF